MQKSGEKCFDSTDFALQQQRHNCTAVSAVLPGNCLLGCKLSLGSSASDTTHSELCCLQKSGRKCFDSADFALQQQGRLSTIVSGDLSVPEQPIETLAPKLSPTQPAPRRMSNLGDSD